jgi:hypothetical protein
VVDAAVGIAVSDCGRLHAAFTMAHTIGASLDVQMN